MHRGLNHHQSGFTLIEMIMVMVITGILAGMVALFLQRPIDLYIDSARRAELTDVADTTARRIARDLQGALPNSVRVDGTGHFIEFIPITTAGRYRAELGLNPACPAVAPCDDILDFNTAADSTFDVLGPAINVNANESLVVYNLGIAGADAYEVLTNRRVATVGTGLSKVSFTATSNPLPFASPSSRFQIVATPVTYACDSTTGTLWRYSGYGFQAGQPTSLATLDGFAGRTKAVLATRLGALCSFAYDAVLQLQHNGLVSISLSFSMSGESVQLQHQVNVDNVP